MEFLVDGAWTKRLHPALAARNGIEAAVMASSGYLGTLDGIAGTRGFLAAYSNAPNPSELLAGWGERPLEVAVTSVKAHTCCRYNQGAIDAVVQLRSAYGLGPEEVESVVIGVPSVAVDIVLEPADSKRRPLSVVDAQFSLPFGVAAALRFGRAGLAEFVDEVIVDPHTTALMDRVAYEVDPQIDAVYPDEWHAWARIVTTDGRILSMHVTEPKGDPGNPLTAVELEAKFRALTDGILSTEAQHQLIDISARFGTRGSFSALLNAL
jgi:2-methylcitrate dehydratase PrpD